VSCAAVPGFKLSDIGRRYVQGPRACPLAAFPAPAAEVAARTGARLQPHEQHDAKPDPTKPKEPDRRDKRAKWLLFVIAILLGLTVSQVAKRFL
jgi:hypothetical protein